MDFSEGTSGGYKEIQFEMIFFVVFSRAFNTYVLREFNVHLTMFVSQNITLL